MHRAFARGFADDRAHLLVESSVRSSFPGRTVRARIRRRARRRGRRWIVLSCREDSNARRGWRVRTPRPLVIKRLRCSALAKLVGQRAEAPRRAPPARSWYRAARRLRAASATAFDAEANAAARADRLRATTTSTSPPTGNALRESASLATPVSLDRDEAGAAGREEHEDAELLVALDLARQACARHDPAAPTAVAARRAREPSGSERDTDPLLLGIDAQDLERGGHARRDRSRPASRPAGGRETSRHAPALRRPARARRTRRTRRGASRGR